MSLIIGKWYVVDRFAADQNKGEASVVAGPFDTKEEAETERVQLNIADDCFVARKREPIALKD